MDFCDRCPARAAYRYERHPHPLTMCGHHGRQHGKALRDAGWFTYRIAELTRA